MQKATLTVLLLVLLTLTSCKNAIVAQEATAAHTTQSTAYLKDTPLELTASVLENTSPALRDFYAAHGNVTLWTCDEDRYDLQAAIKEAIADGLLPEDYNLNYLEQFEALNTITQDECLRYDLMMTGAFCKLGEHLFKGKLQPQGIYEDWSLNSKPFDAVKLQTDALENHNVLQALNSCRPKHQIYGSLRNSLMALYALPDDKNLPVVDWEQSIKLNDTTPQAAAVATRLTYWGDLPKNDTITPIYNKEVESAVKKFQKRHGLYPDGIVGKGTARALNISRAQRTEQVIANLERWRWFPYEFGDHALLINIPTFNMAVLENGKDTIQTYKVVVGKPERRTPVLESRITNVIINPTWTVPPTIIREDLTPAATKDRAYFSQHNMKIYRGEDEVQPWAWKPEEYDKYRYVQSPGDHNALGRVKFNFRNRYSVYLHDTNHRNLFGSSYRALSSGCVRVEDPFKLAEYILQQTDPDWDREKINEVADTKETESIYIEKSIRVHQLYWTAWMDSNGLQFRDDIYSLDKILYDKLRQDL